MPFDNDMLALNCKVNRSVCASTTADTKSHSDDLGSNCSNGELSELVEEIRSFQSFQDGWDGPSSKGPTAEAIENALTFLNFWKNKVPLEPELAFSGTIALQMYDLEGYTLGGIRFVCDGSAFYSIVNRTRKVASRYFEPASESDILQSVREIEIALGKVKQ